MTDNENENENEKLSPKAATRLLRRSEIGGDLRNAFRRIVPPRLTRGTLDRLIRYLAHRGRMPSSEPMVHDLSDSRIGTDLQDRWESEGGTIHDLVKFIAMGEYRIRTLQAASWAQNLESASSSELMAFWMAGGHDLTELAGFLRRIDREVGDWLPK
jgi:hypothetical protein